MENKKTVQVLVDGVEENIELSSQFLVGFAGKENVEYGFALEQLENDDDDASWACDLYFRNKAFEAHDPLAFVWLEESKASCAQARTPQEAVDYALGSLASMIQQMSDSGHLDLDQGNGNKMTIVG